MTIRKSWFVTLLLTMIAWSSLPDTSHAQIIGRRVNRGYYTGYDSNSYGRGWRRAGYGYGYGANTYNSTGFYSSPGVGMSGTVVQPMTTDPGRPSSPMTTTSNYPPTTNFLSGPCAPSIQAPATPAAVPNPLPPAGANPNPNAIPR